MRRPKSMGLFFRVGVVAGTVLLLTIAGPPAPADDGPERRSSIVISHNSQFDADHGVRSGKGTASNPYVISGWDVDRLEIHDTSAHVVIHDNIVRSTMRLNWIGHGVHVMDNKVGDLRVNQNVKRTGAPTSGHFAHNTFGFVGQIRHFDGVFEHNVVKPGAQFFDWDVIPFVRQGPAVNFDGFNGARFQNNTIYGALRAQLHGHHHSSGFGEHSHHHSGSSGDVDHSKRYHEVWITNNVIYSDGPYALSYTDQVHAANDRTAASETEPDLNESHVHHTRVHLSRNKLIGAGLFVDVFNANDSRHTATSRGLVEILRNRITITPVSSTDLFDYKFAGVEVSQARDIKLRVVGNEITAKTSGDGLPDPDLFYGVSPAGIKLWRIELGALYLYDNLVARHDYGIQASQFKDVVWYIDDLRTRNVNQDVSYDNSSNPPEDRPEP
ncbi:MAG: hypothetical protein M3280_05615 [Actinomycetota bacterium]|nr:hypothetical protein [Actinomycetota bacterium]